MVGAKILSKTKLMEQFEKETGNRSIWGGKETKKFIIWKSSHTVSKLDGLQEDPIIISRLDQLEERILAIEKKLKIKNNLKPKKIKKSKILSTDVFSQIVNEKIRKLSKNVLGLQKIPIKKLFDDISKEYDISKKNFSKNLLSLHNHNKVQLESGMTDNDFAIRDNYGNVFKIVELLE